MADITINDKSKATDKLRKCTRRSKKNGRDLKKPDEHKDRSLFLSLSVTMQLP